MMSTSKTHWPSILILMILAIGTFVYLSVSLATGLASLVNLFDPSTDPAGTMIQSLASGLESILLLVFAWFVLEKTMQKDRADRPVQLPFQTWQFLVAPLIVLACIGIGAVIALSEVKWLGWLTLPTLTLPVIILPILFFLGVGIHDIELPSRWKVGSTLGLGMTIGPMIMILLEIAVLFLFVIAAVLAVSAQPQVMDELGRLGLLLNEGLLNEEAVIEQLAPYITHPAVIASIFLYLALIVPLIEELIKPLGVWLFARQITSPATGFALGMLSGGIFALVESLNASGDGSAGWFAVVSVRAGTSLLHMTTSGLMGYAIVQLAARRQVGRMIATYAAAVLLHGLWNACAVGTAFGALGQFIGKPEWLWNVLPAALCGLAVLAIGMFAILLAANRKVRSQAVPAEQPVEEEGKIP